MLAAPCGVGRSTVGRAIGEVPPLLAGSGVRVDGGARIASLADAVACLTTTATTGCLNATDVQVRGPWANRAGRKAFVSGGHCRDTAESLVVTDPRGRLVFAGEHRPGRIEPPRG